MSWETTMYIIKEMKKLGIKTKIEDICELEREAFSNLGREEAERMYSIDVMERDYCG